MLQIVVYVQVISAIVDVFFEKDLVKLSLISPIKGKKHLQNTRLDNDDNNNNNNNQVLAEVKGENWYHC